jgi:hypothetical protein
MKTTGAKHRRLPTRLIAVSITLLITAHRLPAPIQEIPESPTPAPEESARSKPKRTTRAKATSESSESSTKRQTASSPQTRPTQNPTPFAGTWVAKTGFPAGVTLIVSPAQDSAVVKGLPIWGDRAGRPVANGNTLSWTFLAEKWNMVIAPDGKTAVVTDHGWPAGVATGTFVKSP